MRLYEVGEANLRKRSATSSPYSRCYLSRTIVRAQRGEERNEVSTAEFPRALILDVIILTNKSPFN